MDQDCIESVCPIGVLFLWVVAFLVVLIAGLGGLESNLLLERIASGDIGLIELIARCQSAEEHVFLEIGLRLLRWFFDVL